MPAAMQYPDNPKDVESLAHDERRDRAKHTEAAWKYYDGDHKKPLKVKAGQPDDNVILNLSKKLVKSGVAMMVGPDLRFELVEGETTVEEEYLRRVWRANKRNILLTDVCLNGFVTGHPVVKTLPARDDDGVPRIVNIDPSIMTAFWRPDDVERVLWYTLHWNEAMRQDIVRQPGGTWEILDYQKREGRWELAGEPEVWPYRWAPILDWKNLPRPNEYYGESDLENADLNDAVNFIASNTNRIIKQHAHPKTIGKGMSADDVQATSIEGLLTVPKVEADIFNLEMQSDLRASLSFLDIVRTAFFSLSHGVDLTSFKDRVGQITNFGLRVLFKDALDQLEIKQALYGDAFEEMNRRILEFGGYGPDHRVRVHWPEPLPVDERETTDAKVKQVDTGLASRETASTELGHDYEVERERMEAGSE